MIKSAFVVLFGALTLEAQELDKFGWIAGCWQSQSGPLTIDEQWMRPAGGLMLGIGRTVRNGKAVFHEFLDRARLGRGLAGHDHERDDQCARNASDCETPDPI